MSYMRSSQYLQTHNLRGRCFFEWDSGTGKDSFLGNTVKIKIRYLRLVLSYMSLDFVEFMSSNLYVVLLPVVIDNLLSINYSLEVTGFPMLGILGVWLSLKRKQLQSVMNKSFVHVNLPRYTKVKTLFFVNICKMNLHC